MARYDKSDSRNSREQQAHTFCLAGREEMPSFLARPQANARRTLTQEYSRHKGSESRQARSTDSGISVSICDKRGICHAHWYSATACRTALSYSGSHHTRM